MLVGHGSCDMIHQEIFSLFLHTASDQGLAKPFPLVFYTAAFKNI